MSARRAVEAKRKIVSLADLVATFRAQPEVPQAYDLKRRGGTATIVLIQARDSLHGGTTGQIELREFGSMTDTIVMYDLVEDARAIGLAIGAVTAMHPCTFHAYGTWKTMQ